MCETSIAHFPTSIGIRDSAQSRLNVRVERFKQFEFREYSDLSRLKVSPNGLKYLKREPKMAMHREASKPRPPVVVQLSMLSSPEFPAMRRLSISRSTFRHTALSLSLSNRSERSNITSDSHCPKFEASNITTSSRYDSSTARRFRVVRSSAEINTKSRVLIDFTRDIRSVLLS